ncbi:MAG: hypothetical protein RBJ76_28635 [Stenomitos frigidus ULC029]
MSVQIISRESKSFLKKVSLPEKRSRDVALLNPYGTLVLTVKPGLTGVAIDPMFELDPDF